VTVSNLSNPSDPSDRSDLPDLPDPSALPALPAPSDPSELIELDVGAVAHGGFCVARHQGRVVFVRHALPGERVLAVVTDSGHDAYWRADAVRVLRPSPDRVPAPCPVARPGGCGGCDWQHASPRRQLRLKADVVREQLLRIAKLDVDVVVEPLPGGSLGWRTRVQLAVGPDGRAGLRAHREQRVVPIEDCPITVPGVLPPVLARRWTAGTTVEVTVDDDAAVHVTELAGSGHARHTRARAAEDGAVVRRAAGRVWRLPAGAFWQVHRAAAETFAAAVRDFAAAPSGGMAWDLYGGVGLFAAVLAEQVGPDGSVVVVESSRAAAAGMANLRDLPNVRWLAGRVERILPQLPGQPDVVVLDPPRRGAGRAVAQAVARRSPARIVHVACDPAALARDVAAYAEHGYRLGALRAFDAFPMTHHVEVVAMLVRG
jgi:tRNA/tmRNA/rRNA uracil-C5-methylase (TrmA/RlmC/RlmD family)